MVQFVLHRTGQTQVFVREGTAVVKRRPPPWRFQIERGERQWTAAIRIPLKGLGRTPKAGDRWRFNLQRHAALPRRIDAKRALSRIVRAQFHTKAGIRPAAEWTCWSPTWSRIDNAERMGCIILD